jgi:hypothetical protein
VRRVAVAVVAVTLGLLAGCGSDDEGGEVAEASSEATGTTGAPAPTETTAPDPTGTTGAPAPTETTAPDPAPSPGGGGEPGGTTTPQGSQPADPGTGGDPEIPEGCYLVMHTITGDRPFVREIALRSTGEVVARSTDGGPWEPEGWQEACAP